MVVSIWSRRREGILETHSSMIIRVIQRSEEEKCFREVGGKATLKFFLPTHWLNQHGWVPSTRWALDMYGCISPISWPKRSFQVPISWFTHKPLNTPLPELGCQAKLLPNHPWLPSLGFLIQFASRKKVEKEYEWEYRREVKILIPKSSAYFLYLWVQNPGLYRTESYASIIATHNWYPINCLLSRLELNQGSICIISYSQSFIDCCTFAKG